jgi:plastocyanin
VPVYKGGMQGTQSRVSNRGGFVLLKFVLLGCLLLVCLIGAGCGGYTELEYRKPLDTIEVDLAGARTLEPSEITLDRPGTYAFRVKNVSDDVAHALEIRSTDGAKIDYKEGSVRTEDLPPGESAPEFKVDLGPGTYEISCPVGHHKEEGMKGTLTVKED